MKTQAIAAYAASFVAFLALDLLWLGVVARGFYREQLGDLLRPDTRWGAALAFYLLYIAGVVVFAVLPAAEKASLVRALVLGGFFGLVAYAAYDLTSLATTRGFPLLVAVVDLIWGTVLTASVAAAGYLVAARFGG
ncbi:MAG: DUF2177 family protein [Thermoanaerobaculia bacterium]|nr:DUF2177 family protein [Thermoanaerobaculia bacterium]